MEICKHLVKVLFPFCYNVNKDNQLDELRFKDENEKEKILFQRFALKQTDLRQGLPEVFAADDNSSQIVKCYRIDGNNRAHFDLPRRKDEQLKFYCRAANLTEAYNVAIPEVNLYLFESGVGLVELECVYQSSDITDYINCNYFISEIKSKSNYFVTNFKKRASKDEEYVLTEVRFTVKELLGKVLTYVADAKDFYSPKGKELFSQKGLVYSYLYLDERPQDFETLLFNFRNNYKKSYLAPQDLSLKDSAVRKPFENCYWTASYNAVVNVCIRTENEETNEFYSNELYSRLNGVYHLLFLAVLHQRFAIMQLMGKMGELDKLGEDFETMRTQLAIARQYQAEAANLKFRVFFKYPSYVEHVNGYYDFLHDIYNIDALYNHFSTDLSNLEKICNVYVERIRTREEQLKQCKAAKIEIFVGIFGTIVGIVSLMSDSWGLLEKFLGTTIERFSWPVFVMTALLWMPSILVFIDAKKRFREIKKIKADIAIEELKYPTIEDIKKMSGENRSKKVKE